MNHSSIEHSSFRPTAAALTSPLLAFVAAASMFCATAAWADSTTPQSSYEKQRAACMSGKTNEDQATCLKEAGAARDESKRGNLNDNDANYRKNEMERCKALAGDEKKDCYARMKGSGTVSGSVGGGGIVREKHTTTVVKPAEVVVAPAASSPN